MKRLLIALSVAFWAICAPTYVLAWGGLGHRTVAAIAMKLLPSNKIGHLNKILEQLEIDGDFVDAASYPDEFIRGHDPNHKFDSWHFADLPDDDSKFECGACLFRALPDNLTLIGQGPDNKDKAVAIAWVIHLVGDLHQPLHMDERLRGGNNFHVTYRGHTTCSNFSGHATKVELHSAWDDCLVNELAAGRTPQQLADDILGDIKTYVGRPELSPAGLTPWIPWGNDSHVLATDVAFDHLKDGGNLDDSYIKNPSGNALDIVQQQLLKAGIRLAALLDQNFQ